MFRHSPEQGWAWVSQSITQITLGGTVPQKYSSKLLFPSGFPLALGYNSNLLLVQASNLQQ